MTRPRWLLIVPGIALIVAFFGGVVAAGYHLLGEFFTLEERTPLTEEQLASLLVHESDLDTGWSEVDMGSEPVVDLEDPDAPQIGAGGRPLCDAANAHGPVFSDPRMQFFVYSIAEGVCGDADEVLGELQTLEDDVVRMAEANIADIATAMNAQVGEVDVSEYRTDIDDALWMEMRAEFHVVGHTETLHQVNVVVASDDAKVITMLEGWGADLPDGRRDWAADIARERLGAVDQQES